MERRILCFTDTDYRKWETEFFFEMKKKIKLSLTSLMDF